MRVALLAPEFLPVTGGVGSYTVELARELADKCELHIITPKRKGSRRIDDAFFHYVGHANNDFAYNCALQLRLKLSLNNLLAKIRPDIVHNTSLVHMPDVFCRWDYPHVTTIHTTIESQSLSKNPLFYSISFLQNRYIEREKNFIAVSRFIQSKIAKPSTLIYNGIDVDRFKPKKENKKTVLFCGRMLEQKGLREIAASIKSVHKETGARFVFAGRETSESRDILGPVHNYCRFLGYVDFESVHEVYQDASVVILPSHAESNPKTVIEGMACGKPVIASDVGGVQEIIDSRNGILLQSSVDLAGELVKLLSDDTLRKKIGASARKTAEKRFSSALMARKTIQFYKQVLDTV